MRSVQFSPQVQVILAAFYMEVHDRGRGWE
jgi:hypothetical protein